MKCSNNHYSIWTTMLVAISLANVSSAAAANKFSQPLLPVSNEVIRNSPGPKPECQTEYEAWGVGFGRNRDQASKNCLIDAKRAVCKQALLGGDGLLTTVEQKELFAKNQNDFYRQDIINSFFVHASDAMSMRKLDNKGRNIKTKYMLVLDYCLLSDWLSRNGILKSKWYTASIMVLPTGSKAASPIEYLSLNPNARHAKSVIENFLTSEGNFELLEPDASQSIEDLVKVTGDLEGKSEDIIYRIAISNGADIYIRFETSIEESSVAGAPVQKAIVRVEAYETTTGRKIRSQTCYSEARPRKVSEQALIEEALSFNFRDIMQGMKKYWEAEAKRGVQYLLVMSIPENIDKQETMTIQDCFQNTVNDISMINKPEIITNLTMRYRVWVDINKIGNVNELGNELRNAFSGRCADWRIHTGNQNIGKLLTGNIVAD